MNRTARDYASKKAGQLALFSHRLNESSPLSEFIDDWYNADFGKMNQAVYDEMLSDAEKRKNEYNQTLKRQIDEYENRTAKDYAEKSAGELAARKAASKPSKRSLNKSQKPNQ